MKKINKKDLITYSIMFIITCLIFSPLLTGHYASDSYNIYNIGYHDYAIKYSLNDGRIFMAILGLIASKINISIDTYAFITLFFALIISNITIMVLNKIIKKYKEPKNIFQEIIVIIISYITVFNFMYLENMYFVECIVMAASVLLFIISADILVEKNNKYFIKSTILTILGIMFYQGTIGIFFAFVFLFTILKNKNNIKQIIIDLIKSGIIAAIGVLVDLIIVKIVGCILNMNQSRYGSLADISKNIKYIISVFPRIMKVNCGLFPKNILIIFLNILTIIVVLYQIRNLKKGDYTIYKFLAIIVITILSGFVIHLTTLTSIDTGRLKNSLGALVGIIFIFLYIETDLLDNKGKLSKITILTMLVFAIINIFNYENVILQHKKVNYLEKEEVQKLDEYINNYEETTGIKVTKIVKIPSYNKSKGYFTSIKNKSIYAYNSMRTYWAADGIINFYTNRNLVNVRITKKEKENYENNRDEQKGYECIDDTLYIDMYII